MVADHRFEKTWVLGARDVRLSNAMKRDILLHMLLPLTSRFCQTEKPNYCISWQLLQLMGDWRRS
jgi:hypothetical protein